MLIVNAQEEHPKTFSKSVFLAGPTSRNYDDLQFSWRREAIDYLEKIAYDGVVFVPELRHPIPDFCVNKQISWEQTALNMSDVILFWIPRNMKTLPALTTNIEFGMYMASEKCIVGCPPDAENMDYIRHCCSKTHVYSSLRETVAAAVDHIQKHSPRLERTDGERCVPLPIWNSEFFQTWIQSHKKQGNRLDNAILLSSYADKSGLPIMCSFHVSLHIASENRTKENEMVVFRPDVSTVVLHYTEDDTENSMMTSSLDKTKFILVREFRSAVCNRDGFVLECPGGSKLTTTDSKHEFHRHTALEEVFEETGIRLDKNQLRYVASRQILPTLSSHKMHVFAARLSKDQFDFCHSMAAANTCFGNDDETEKTYIRILSFAEIIANQNIDMSMVGAILSCFVHSF